MICMSFRGLVILHMKPFHRVSILIFFNKTMSYWVLLKKRKKKKQTNKQMMVQNGVVFCQVSRFFLHYIFFLSLSEVLNSLSRSRLASHWLKQVLTTGSLRQTTASIRFNGLSLYSFETLSWFIHLQPQVHCILYLVYTIILSSIPPVTVTYLFFELVYLVYPFMFFSLCFLLLPT